MKQSKHLLVLDSGVGGLTIASALRERRYAVTFEKDAKNFPYGTKSEEVLLPLVVEFAQECVAKHKPDLLVLACNTASTIALGEIRRTVSCPVVGVVPAVKPAAAVSKTKVCGLLATVGSVKTPYLKDLIEHHAADCQWQIHGSSRLVTMAEEKVAGKKIDLEEVKNEIAPLFVDGLDTVVLGCTHFPHLRDELLAASPWSVQWIDSTDAIVRRVEHILKEDFL